MNNHFGAALREARTARSLEQRDVAELLGLSESTISKIESGVRGLSASEMLTLGLLFPSWFEVQVEEIVQDLKANLATRLRQLLSERTFKPMEFEKRDWLKQRLAELDGEPTIIA